MPNYISDGSIGVDLNTVGSARAFALGSTFRGSNGSEYMYVLSAAAQNQGALVGVDGAGTVTALTGGAIGTASASPDLYLGFVQNTFAASQCGFVALRGANVLVRVAGAVSQEGRALFTTDTAGCIGVTTASASQFQVFGVYVGASVSASGSSQSVVTANVSFPLIRYPKDGG
jgi:hypothetical protein